MLVPQALAGSSPVKQLVFPIVALQSCGALNLLIGREAVNDSEQIVLLTEIRDLQRQQVELTQQTIENQETALSNQQKAIDRQISNQEILIKARRWTRILLALLVVAAFLYLLQPLIFLLLAHSR